MTRPARVRFSTVVRLAHRVRQRDSEGENLLTIAALVELRDECTSLLVDMAAFMSEAGAKPPTLGNGALVCGAKHPSGATCTRYPHHVAVAHADAATGFEWRPVVGQDYCPVHDAVIVDPRERGRYRCAQLATCHE